VLISSLRLLVVLHVETLYTHPRQSSTSAYSSAIDEPTGMREGMIEEDIRKDFFISYTSADCTWAEWIAWQLEQAGYSTVIQAWDFTAGSNFVLEMDKSAKAANRTIAVLSPNYFDSGFASSEWAASFRQDPLGKRQWLHDQLGFI
jgi:hypothetical protein